MGYLEIKTPQRTYKIPRTILDYDFITQMDIILSSIPEYKKYIKWVVKFENLNKYS